MYIAHTEPQMLMLKNRKIEVKTSIDKQLDIPLHEHFLHAFSRCNGVVYSFLVIEHCTAYTNGYCT